MERARALVVFAVLLFASNLWALTFTGNATNDFRPESCFADPKGMNIAFPASFPAGSISGFDVDKICLLYDQPSDILYVGIATFNNPLNGLPIPFGDADGDGDPGHTSTALAQQGGTDWPDLSTEEYFALIFDFDADLTTPPDVVAGISAPASAPGGFRVASVALPHLGIDFAFENNYYGTVLQASTGSKLFASPSVAEPHLEFTITGLAKFPGITNLNVANPDTTIEIIFKAGSLGDIVLGDEDIRLFPQLKDFFDVDGDGIPNRFDTDSDNDGLSDSDEAKIGTDPRNPDTDGDGLSDGDEVKRGTDPKNPDTDGDGIPDGTEVRNGTDPNFPENKANPVPAGAPAATPTPEPVQFQGSGPASCMLVPPSHTPSDRGNIDCWIIGIGFLLLLIQRLRPRRFFFNGFFFILLLSIPKTSEALNAEQFRPHFDNLGLINLLTSRTLERHAWSVGTGLSYSHEPLSIGLVSTGAATGPLVDYQVNMSLTGAYGINDWVELGLSVPFFPALRREPFGTDPGGDTAAFGDLGVAAKFRIWHYGNDSDGVKMGIAVSPYLVFPSGSTEKFTGNTSVTGGFHTVYDIDIGANKLVGNIALRFREKENLSNLTIGQELLYGVGFTRPIWQPYDLHVVTELNGSTALNGMFTNSNRSPLEWLTGVRKGFMDSKIQWTVAGSFGITNGYGTPDFRVLSLLSYVAAPWREKPKPETPTSNEPKVSYKSYVRLEGGKIVILEPIHFATAKWDILPQSLPVVQAVADVMIHQPQIRHVVVKGHTDARGSTAANLKLSQHRAQAVVAQLIKFGVETKRLSAEGWGESQPIATNRTPAGMAKNRRVEFHIVEVQSGV